MRACVVVLAVAAVAAAKPEPIAWKWPKKPFYVEYTTRHTEELKLPGREQKGGQELTFLLGFRLVKSLPDGSVVLEQTIESAEAFKTGGTKKLKDASMDRLVGKSVRLTFDKTLALTDVEGLDDVVRKLGDGEQEAPPAAKALLRSALDGMVRFLAGEVFVPVPGGPAKSGATWAQKTGISVGPIGDVAIDKTFTLRPAERGEPRSIDVAAELAFRSTPGGPKFKDAKVRSGHYTGRVGFDPAAGRVTETNVTMDLDLALTLRVGDEDTEVEAKRTQTIGVKFLDEAPPVK